MTSHQPFNTTDLIDFSNLNVHKSSISLFPLASFPVTFLYQVLVLPKFGGLLLVGTLTSNLKATSDRFLDLFTHYGYY